MAFPGEDLAAACGGGRELEAKPSLERQLWHQPPLSDSRQVLEIALPLASFSVPLTRGKSSSSGRNGLNVREATVALSSLDKGH